MTLRDVAITSRYAMQQLSSSLSVLRAGEHTLLEAQSQIPRAGAVPCDVTAYATTHGAVTNPKAAPTATTRDGIGRGTPGSATQPNATNNPKTGTQAPDAQKGGSGTSGAR